MEREIFSVLFFIKRSKTLKTAHPINQGENSLIL